MTKRRGKRNAERRASRERSVSAARPGVRKQTNWVNLILAVLIVAGVGFLLLRRYVFDNQALSGGATPVLPSGRIAEIYRPPPIFIEDRSSGGGTTARIDEPGLRAWCREYGLPDPPDFKAVEPEVARALRAAMEGAVRAPGADSYGLLGQISESLDCHTSAEWYFNRAIALDPADYRWPYYLGCIFHVTGRAQDAITQFQQVLKLNPDHALTHARLGDLHLETADLAAARRSCLRYVELAESDSLGYVCLGRVDMREQRPDDAVARLEEAIRRFPNDFQAHYQLGRALAQLGRADEAKHHFDTAERLPQGKWFYLRDSLDQALHRTTASAQTLLNAFELSSGSGDWPRLATLAEEIIRRRPTDTLMMANLASIRRKQKRYDDAHRVIADALSLQPGSIRLHRVRSEVYLAESKLDEAVEAAEAALRVDNHDAGAHAVRARALLLKKEFDDAESAIRSAITYAPNNPTHPYVLGEILLSKGAIDDAAKAYRRSLDINEGYAPAKQRLRELER